MSAVLSIVVLPKLFNTFIDWKCFPYFVELLDFEISYVLY